MKVIEVPGHGEVEFPDEMSDQAISAAIQKNIIKTPPKSDYGDILGSPTEQVLAGIGHGMVNVGRGVGQAFGMIPQADIDEAKRLDQTLMQSGYGKTGDVIGSVAATLPAMAVPGANTVLGGAALGGALGGLQPVASDESRLQNAGLGALGGGVGALGAKALSRALSPKLAQGAKELMDEGVTLTPGQMIGGGFKTAEEKMSSIPVIGDFINAAQRRGQESFNKAALARALKGMGQTPSGEIGREGVSDVSSKLSAAYNDLLPKLKFQADPQFIQDITKIRGMASGLPENQAAQFDKILKDQFYTKMTDAGLMNGESVKALESELGRLAKGYKGDASFDNRQLGDALSAVQQSIRENLARVNPAHAEELSNINQAYANYARIRDAASRTGAKEGIFSPAQLAAAVRAGDKSVGKGQYAKGQALMQDLADTGQEVIGNRYPDSGTAGRAMLPLALGGAATISPTAAIGGGLGALLYTKPGQQLAKALLAVRPELARQLAGKLETVTPALSASGAGYALGNQ